MSEAEALAEKVRGGWELGEAQAASAALDALLARLAEAEKDCEANDNVRKEYLAAARKAVTRAETAEARLAEAEKERDQARGEFGLAVHQRNVAQSHYAELTAAVEAAEADRDRLRAFVAKARPFLGMDVPGSVGAEASELLA